MECYIYSSKYNRTYNLFTHIEDSYNDERIRRCLCCNIKLTAREGDRDGYCYICYDERYH